MEGIFLPQRVDRSHPSIPTFSELLHFPSAQAQRLRQALQASQADRDTAQLDKELLAQRLQGLEQEAENKKRSQDDRTRQLKGLEVRTLGGWPLVGGWWARGAWVLALVGSVRKGARTPQLGMENRPPTADEFWGLGPSEESVEAGLAEGPHWGSAFWCPPFGVEVSCCPFAPGKSLTAGGGAGRGEEHRGAADRPSESGPGPGNPGLTSRLSSMAEPLGPL